MLNKIILLTFLTFFAIPLGFAQQDLLSVFPLEHYDQNVSTWLKPNSPSANQSLLNREIQQVHLDNFLSHYVGTNSPWNAAYINQIFNQAAPNNLKTVEQGIIAHFNNSDKPANEIGYGENFRPHNNQWINAISNNIPIAQFDHLVFQQNNRAIVIHNLTARALPTTDPYYYSHKNAGEGYPFDYLQMSALWIGTPVYIVAETNDHAWLYVITPDYFAWVKASGIARVDNTFVNKWSVAAKTKLAAITKTQTNLMDSKNKFIAQAYVGSVFPVISNHANYLLLMIPAVDNHHNAIIKYAMTTTDFATVMPLLATESNFAMIISTLINRPYGWGNLYFYNDCSAELKSLFTPFGIWLPRHSSDQMTIGKTVDLSSDSKEGRLAYLMQNGKPFLSLINTGGHVMVYIGNYANPARPQEMMAMTYQNLWGLSPNPPVRRAVIGQSVLLPLLMQYPEDISLTSLAAKKIFQISYLDQPQHKHEDNLVPRINLLGLTY